ncbi:MAG TPA: GNAT family N-acetyltransferase [Solirubrobacterales bacterium]|nr:GNAT family N-acetyltransferase [Solirubrobacterales bacterium]
MDSGSEAPRRLEVTDADRAARVFARAFAWHEPWGDWAMPDPSDREERIYAQFHRDLLERFIPYGECWTIGAGTATTMWVPPGVEQLASRRTEAAYAAYGDRADELRAGDALIASLKPKTEHWYLDTIATDPDLHGQGLGGRLLDHDLAVRDAAGDACALDTHTPENIGFYARRGFEVIGEGRLGAGLDVYMMFRGVK